MHTKSISSGSNKRKKWVTTPRPGKHRRGESMPLLTVVRDILGLVDNAREAAAVIRDGMVYVDKKPRKDPKYGVGLMDVVEIPAEGVCYRVLPTSKGLVLKKIPDSEANTKLCSVLSKATVKNGLTQLRLHDGSTLVVDKKPSNIRDTLVIELPDMKVKDRIEFKEGNTALVAYGRHSGEVGKINMIRAGTATHRSLTKVGDDLQTLTSYVFVVGKTKPVISLT